MKIAFATKNNITIDDHFGWCRQFAIYEVNSDGFRFLDIRDVFEDGGEESDRIDKRIDAIHDCSILYCIDIGPAAAARVVRERIHPIKVSQPELIKEVLYKIVMVLKKPPIWLRKILEREASVIGEREGEG